MEDENMMNKINIKHGATIQTIFISIALAICFIVVIFNFVNENAAQVNIPINSSYTDVANQFESKNLTGFVSNFREAGKSVREADIYEFGVNGIKGIFNLFLLPFDLYDIAYDMMARIFGVSTFIAPPIIVAIELVIGMIIIGAAVAFITSRGKEA